MTSQGTDTRAELLACPFCGSKHSEIYTIEDTNENVESAYVQCVLCDARGSECPSLSDAAKGWNTRAALRAPAEREVVDAGATILPPSLLSAIVAAMGRRAHAYGVDEAWDDYHAVQKWADGYRRSSPSHAREITDEMVERAAEAIYSIWARNRAVEDVWSECVRLRHSTVKEARDEARAALTAALSQEVGK